MRIVIAGGSGFLGRRLTTAWLAQGHDVTVLSRNPARTATRAEPGVTIAEWHPPTVDAGLIAALTGADAIVNLAGVSIGGRPWTPGHKRAILRTRLEATGAIVYAIGALPTSERPAVLVNASGIDVYGDRPDDDVMTEESAPGDSFLAGVVVAWEAAARAAESHGVRVVLSRTAFIIGPEALAWRLLLLPFRLFAGGPLGSGRQRFTWIHVDDAVGLYDLAINDASISGPVNMVAPEVPSERELAGAIGRAMGRPSIFRVPAAILRLALWGQADIVLHGRVAVVTKATDRGYRFAFPTLDAALADVFPKR
jgi:uncharacterized protein (TIGR01777 family)